MLVLRLCVLKGGCSDDWVGFSTGMVNHFEEVAGYDCSVLYLQRV